MNPSDRIKYITQISEMLGQKSWSIIDLTLEQFRLPTTDSWNGNSTDYAVEMLKKASDTVLVDLANHLGISLHHTEDESIVRPKFWRTNTFKIFLSHLSSHQRYAGELQDELSKFGISCFVAHKDVHPTAEWMAEIESALLTCDALVALLHNEFHGSDWTDQEIGFVMGRKKPAFTVKLGRTPYGFIGRFQAFNGEGRATDDLAHEIFKALLVHKETKKTITNILARAFENSGSYDRSGILLSLLECAEYWDEEIVAVIRSALKNNSQVYDERHKGVPKRTQALIDRWSL